MERRFYYTYYFNKEKYRTCLDNDITKKDIESTIQSYIYNNNICREYNCIIKYNNLIGLEFNIVNITDGEYSIQVHNVFRYKKLKSGGINMSKTIRLGFINDEAHKYMSDRDNLYFVRRVLEEKEKGNLVGNIRISDKSIDYHVRETEGFIDIIIECLYDVY